MILAVVLSVGVLFAFDAFLGPTTTPPAEQATQTTADGTPPAPGADGLPAAPGTPATAPGVSAPGVSAPGGPLTPDRDQFLTGSERIKIDTPRLHGSIRLQGARLDDLTLGDYQETIEDNSPEVVLLSPQGSANPYYSEFGWVPADAAVPVPDKDTPWTTTATVLNQDSPVTLTWDNGAGLIFTRTIAVDADYMFTITQSVQNTGSEQVTLFPYGLVKRNGLPKLENFFILHEGPIGVVNGALEEVSYGDLDDDRLVEYDTTGGWVGITDKFWLTALAFDQTRPVKARFVHSMSGNQPGYQADYLGQAVTLSAGASDSIENHLFAGAKEVNLLDTYAERFNLPLFDRAIDFGWFFFITIPFFHMLNWLANYLGSFGLAILAFTVILKLIFFPLMNKSYRAMGKMKALAPEMKKLQERFKDDRQRMNQELMTLYKKEKVNPLAGCWPILLQIPVFFALYKVLFVTIEMRHAPFYGWIEDLSAPDPTSIFNAF
ncbi:MAG: membrane protein insertase YidC, partial [Rhodospirillaceae bacterium]